MAGRHGRTSLILAMMVLAPVAFAVEASAVAPVLAQETREGPGWVAFRVAEPGNVLTLDLSLRMDGQDAGYGAQVFDADGRAIRTGVGGARGGFVIEWHASANLPPVSSESPRPDAQIATGMRIEAGCAACVPLAGPLLVVVFAGGDVASWGLTMRAPAGAHIVGRSEGADAFVYGARDFRGTLEAGAEVLGVGAQVVRDAHRIVPSGATVVGAFVRTTAADSHQMSARTTAGFQTCPCAVGDLARTGLTYDFRVDGWLPWKGDPLLLTGAHVRAP